MRTTYLLAHTGIAVLLCLALAQSATAQTVFTGKSWSDFPGGAKAACANELDNDPNNDDIDEDNDGLIELCYLEDVDAMRHNIFGNRLKRNGTNLTDGCKNDTCKGYELVRDLNFKKDDSYINTENRQTWVKGDGWPGLSFNQSTIEGNGHTISNLFSKISSSFKGFATTNNGSIQNLGLLNVRIKGDAGRLGFLTVSNNNRSRIANCYVEGSARIKFATVIPLTYGNRGSIFNSYTNIVADGLNDSFAHQNFMQGSIENSYVIGNAADESFVNRNDGTIRNVYSAVNSPNTTEPVFSKYGSGTIENSYWDSDKLEGRKIAAPSGTLTNVQGVSTVALWAPTAPSTTTATPYYNWSTDNWDFGTSEEYPAVRHARGDDNNNPACGDSQQPRCGSLLRGQRDNKQPSIIFPLPDTEIFITAGAERTINVTTADEDVDDLLTIELSEVADQNDIVELVTTSAEVLPNDGNPERMQESLKIRIRNQKADGLTARLRLLAKDNSRSISDPVFITVTVGEEANIAPVIAMISTPQQILETNSTASIVVSIEDINFGVGDEVMIAALSSTPTVASISPAEHTGITANTTRGFTVFAKEGGITDIRFTAEDSKGASVSETVQVRVNTSPKVTGAAPTGPVITTVGEEFRLATSAFFSDADGDVLTYQVTGLPNSITMITTDTLSGIPLIGDAMMNNGRFSITVSVDDGNGGSAEVMFTLLIDAKPSGTVSIAFTPWQLTATSNIMDDNDIASMSYQWYRDDTQIGSETSDRYSIPNTHLGRTAGTQYYVEATIVDHIGQSVTFTSNVYEVVNEAPTISAITQIGVNEGETVSISPTIADANRDSLTYSWSVTSGDTSPSILAGVATNEASLSFEVPPDWIADTVTDNAQRTLQIQLTVSDGSLSAMRAASVVVTKINNSVITIPGIDRDDDDDLRAFSIEVDLNSDEDGENNSPGLSYQWQQCLGSDTNIDCDMEGNWRDIMNATSDSYRAASAAVGDRYRVKISYTDAQGYSEEVLSHERPFDTSNDIRIRAKIFLEGSLQ